MGAGIFEMCLTYQELMIEWNFLIKYIAKYRYFQESFQRYNKGFCKSLW